ncbi:MAG: PBECR4 domain-containing protein [Clostridiales bacterium]|nr:PBECR4 domain-containing protein [Clostridiales bacterium]
MGRNLLFILSDKHLNITSLEVNFEKRNFLHLTGVKTDLTASRFFDHCIDGTLSPNDFEFSKDGTTLLKLKVLPQIMTKNLNASNMVGDFCGSNIFLKTKKLVGGVKACVGFVKSGNIGYVPNTLLNIDIREITPSTLRVVTTYRKNISDDTYDEIVYSAKKINWNKITYPEELAYLPKPNSK